MDFLIEHFPIVIFLLCVIFYKDTLFYRRKYSILGVYDS